MNKKDQHNLNQLAEVHTNRSPDFWTVEQFIEYSIQEFGLDAHVLLPDGSKAPLNMTLEELRRLYKEYNS